LVAAETSRGFRVMDFMFFTAASSHAPSLFSHRSQHPAPMKLMPDINQANAVDHSNPMAPKINFLELTTGFVPSRLASRIEKTINATMPTKHGIIAGKRFPDNANLKTSIMSDTIGNKNSSV